MILVQSYQIGWLNRIITTVFVGLFVFFVCSICVAKAQEDSSVTFDDMPVADLVIEGPAPDDWFQVENVPGEEVVGDFVVGPGKIELQINPGESKTVLINVTNRTGQLRRFNLSVEDTAGSREPGKTVDLLGGARGPYTLRDYFVLPDDSFELEHNKRVRVPVTITIPTDAEPGGRYGSVLVNTVAVERREGDGVSVMPQSPIIARVGTLFFVTIPGEVEREGELTKLTTIPESKWFSGAPITFGLWYENTGSVHLSPYGELSVTNIFGEEVGRVELDPWFAMPESLRFREVVWDRANLFGYYKATAKINRGYDNLTDELSVSFYVFPWKIVVVVFVSVLVLLYLVRYLLRNFEFRRKDAS